MKNAAATVAVVLGLCGCGGPAADGDESESTPASTTDGPPAPQGRVPAATDGEQVSGDRESDPAGEPPDSSARAGAGGGEAEQPAMQQPDMQQPDMQQPEADDCIDRRVSYAAPCHKDPNPCGIDSGFPGDNYCILPPAESEGIQIHVGPDDYADPAEIDKYVLEPGQEFNNSVLAHIPLEQDAWFDRITVQMRPGSHHWISSVRAGKGEERFYDGTSCDDSMQIGSIGGGQNLIYDNPPGGVPAPENEGLGRPLPGNSSLCMNLHAYNFSDERQLREMWINIRTVDESAVTQRARGIGVVGGLGLALPPGQSETLTYTETFSAPGRIIQLFGHRHAWTPRFAVWLNDRLIYDSWDWQESVVFNYDSLTTNPEPNPDMQVDGAASGALEVAAGDELTFSCFIENQSDITLRFRNELYGGEMCNLWGSAVGTGISANRF